MFSTFANDPICETKSQEEHVVMKAGSKYLLVYKDQDITDDNMCCPYAVSYTHLDVYKRQAETKYLKYNIKYFAHIGNS